MVPPGALARSSPPAVLLCPCPVVVLLAGFGLCGLALCSRVFASRLSGFLSSLVVVGGSSCLEVLSSTPVLFTGLCFSFSELSAVISFVLFKMSCQFIQFCGKMQFRFWFRYVFHVLFVVWFRL